MMMNSQSAQRVAIVTGASSGIGLATAKKFIGMGWHVVGQGRDPERSANAEAEIRAASANGGKLDFLRANLSLMSETKQLAEAIKSRVDRIDILLNNAGGVRDRRYVTSEGTEETFAANHLAPYLLTRELLPLLEATAKDGVPGGVRTLAVSSSAYQHVSGMNWDDLQNLSGEFPSGPAYCQAKLANQLFNVALARRLGEKGIVSQALVPGPVATNFFNHGDEQMQGLGKRVDAMSADEVAETLIWMATAAETSLPGGRMFYAMQEVPVDSHGLDIEAAERLWGESERLLTSLGYAGVPR
jgi:NAD(P)-dependent dehydrogenase (short-subunit alcohol dehydrogenase family)